MDSSLGKRKDREEGDEISKGHGSTLFVSNLPYSATSVDLQTLFSDIGPVKSAFVVTEQGTGVSKGVGYVSFAMKDDAESAFETISKGDLTLAARKLRAEWATTKPKTKEEGEKVKKEPKPRPPPRPHAPNDPVAIRTIVISGLPPSIDSKVLWKKVRKYDGAEKVDWPVKKDDGTEDPSVAHVLFTAPTKAQDAVNKLHAHVYKGSLLSVTLKKRLDNLAKSIPLVKSSTEAKGKSVAAPSHASRLIVRNIPFNATEQDLRAVFLPYGPIHSVHIPMDDRPIPKKEEEMEETVAESSSAAEKKSKPRTKGFAFVWMLSRKDAERAIEGCNGMTFRAGTAEALVSGKQKRKKLQRIEKKLKEAASAKGGKEVGDDEEGEEEEAEEEAEEVDSKRATERVIAVDWALSKDKWQKEKAKLEEDVEMKDPEDEEDEEGSSESDEDDDEHIGVHSGDDSADEDQEGHAEDEDDEDEKPIKPELPPPEAGTTLFVRNIPFEATDDDLRTLFRAFGPLRYARITMDHATGRSRGTGFACFWNITDADRVIQQSELLRSETAVQTSTQPKKNPFQLPSILTPDPSYSLAHSLVLHGRTLDIVRAVTRDVASKLKETNERMREKADKRNMYLLREGVILPNTPAAATLTPAEIERRTSSFNARRTLLKSNPSLYISKTRLSVRQIPLFVSERMIRRLALHAVKAFNKEVKAKTRQPLTEDELAVDATLVEEEEEVKEVKEVSKEDAEKSNTKKKKELFFKKNANTGVRQAKIVRQAERVDPLSGKGKSKGYGFLEMFKHSDALRFLRWANNNPEAQKLFESWWKDDLKSMLKTEREKPESERDETRISRLKAEIESCDAQEEMGSGEKRLKSRGTLIVEFSIENVQVVQRRSAVQKDKAGPPGKRSRDHAGRHQESAPVTVEEDHDVDPPHKKRRVDSKDKTKKPKSEPTEDDAPSAKSDNKLGSIIGRKRKERKSKGGSRKQ